MFTLHNFCKHLNVCADLRHTNPLEFQTANTSMRKEACSCEKLVGSQADYLNAQASEMDFELFISEVEKRPAMESKGYINLNG